jgi:hypothetical protein
VTIGRVIATLVAGGIALLVAGIALYGTTVHAASPRDRAVPPLQYTSHPGAAAAVKRPITLFVDRDFDEVDRQRIVAALRQWNYVLNGFVGFQAQLLPPDISAAQIEQLRRRGGWIVARVDSRHPVAQKGEGAHALAVTVSNSRSGGYVYVIADRLGGRDLTGVVMHEFGHVLGAGHDQFGLMAPVYSASEARCIDYGAVAMVAQAQHLSLRDLNWCEAPRYDQPFSSPYSPRTALRQVQ